MISLENIMKKIFLAVTLCLTQFCAHASGEWLRLDHLSNDQTTVFIYTDISSYAETNRLSAWVKFVKSDGYALISRGQFDCSSKMYRWVEEAKYYTSTGNLIEGSKLTAPNAPWNNSVPSSIVDRIAYLICPDTKK